MENYFVTITGMNHYLGMNPYKINRLVKLVKEPDNPHDPEAIRVELPFIDTIGYVATVWEPFLPEPAALAGSMTSLKTTHMRR
jgi:hypothetical protein